MEQKTEDTLRDLWIMFKNDGDVEKRNQLIVHYSSLVNRVVNRIVSKYSDYLDIDDLIGYGIFGLIDAIDKFDINKGVKFETYASFRIRGEIIDHLRRQDWVPRSLRVKTKDIEKAMDLLQTKLGRYPKSEELAQSLGITTKELNRTLSQSHTFSILSLDGQVLDVLGSSNELISNEDIPEEYFETVELKETLGEAIGHLTDNEQKIISLYYFDELTFKEIGLVVGISESRVSQLHSRALLKLKSGLNRSGYIIEEESHE